jgi:glycosyltransferase involved in cell wall biosynthesis
MTIMDTKPIVSIGLPVYNGENYLEETLLAIRNQTFAEFELIIADNASTDRTAEICRDHAANDSRIRYVRNTENLGAAVNHNLVLELTRAPLFKWQAHDDQLTPDFLAKSVTKLEADPAAVMCITGARRLDGEGQEILRWNSPLHGTESSDVAVRFGAVIRTFFCSWTEPFSARKMRTRRGMGAVAIYSLMRRDAIVRTMLFRPFRGADIAIIAELALLGSFARLDEPLLIHRDHDMRATRTVNSDPDACLAWYDPKLRGAQIWHKWALYGSHLEAIRRHSLSRSERLRCYTQVVRSMLLPANLKGLARDVVLSIDPRLIHWGRRARRAIRLPLQADWRGR